MTSITLNGKRRELAAGTTVAELIATLELDAQSIAIEVNRRVIPRARHAVEVLAPDDRVEVVTMFGGG